MLACESLTSGKWLRILRRRSAKTRCAVPGSVDRSTPLGTHPKLVESGFNDTEIRSSKRRPGARTGSIQNPLRLRDIGIRLSVGQFDVFEIRRDPHPVVNPFALVNSETLPRSRNTAARDLSTGNWPQVEVMMVLRHKLFVLCLLIRSPVRHENIPAADAIGQCASIGCCAKGCPSFAPCFVLVGAIRSQT